jgi:hypothetical protein
MIVFFLVNHFLALIQTLVVLQVSQANSADEGQLLHGAGTSKSE